MTTSRTRIAGKNVVVRWCEFLAIASAASSPSCCSGSSSSSLESNASRTHQPQSKQWLCRPLAPTPTAFLPSVSSFRNNPCPHRHPSQHNSAKCSRKNRWEPGAFSLRPLIAKTSLWAASDGNDFDETGDDEVNEATRMTNVRMIQNLFYSSSKSSVGETDPIAVERLDDSFATTYLDNETGIFHNLPLWREKLGFTELPGRSLLGFVKDPAYTHMFETILRSDDGPMYFGQLRLNNDDVGINVNAAAPSSTGGSRDRPLPRPKETEMNAPLYSWKDRRVSDDDDTDDDRIVVGTLMRIVDRVRLDDGRLMLLLHAVERFVVLEPKRTLPYPIADCLILPDEEELMAVTSQIESDANQHVDGGVGCAVHESFCKWHGYEYDGSVRFPIEQEKRSEDGIVSLIDVFGTGGNALGTLMPFVPYSSNTDDDACGINNSEKAEVEIEVGNESMKEQRATTNVADSSFAPNLTNLVKKGILKEVASFRVERVINPSDVPDANELELDLWILIDEYVRLRSVTNVFPKHLLGLLPKNKLWPEDFSLDKLANVYSGMEGVMGSSGGRGEEERFVRVCDRVDYPSQRRRKRLSYACTALLGGPVTDHPLLNRTMRRRLLEVPSTVGRLWAARELFEAYNAQFRS